MKLNLPVSGRAVNVGSSANILSTTDLKGAVSYVNQDFIDIRLQLNYLLNHQVREN